METHDVIIRVKSIDIGKDANNTYTWYGIKFANWSDVTPWEHIEIPAGPMVHQHLHSPHIQGEIKCNDLSTLSIAIFNTPINSSNKVAVNQDTAVKTTVEYLKINMINEHNEIIEVFLDGFKVETIGVEDIELGKEALWVIRFTADRVVYGA